MKELGITVNKILKDWLQPKGEGNIVFTDDIAINEVTDEIVAECQGKYSELLKQRDELKEALINVMVVVRDCYPLLFDNEKPAVKQAEATIKNTESSQKTEGGGE